jgi:cytochrome P450 family 150 subfamily A5
VAEVPDLNTTPDLNAVDFFNDGALALDPYPLYEYLASERPVWREPVHGAVVVTGYDEIVQVLRDPATFSSWTIIGGPKPVLPFVPEGDDISAQIEAHRDEINFSDQLPSFDPPKHTAHRKILMGLITPKRLKENEDFILRLTERQLDKILGHGSCEIVGDYAHPYALLVVADLLGVPEADHAGLLGTMGFDINRMPGPRVGGKAEEREHHGLDRLYPYFVEAIESRRREPQNDTLTRMAQATFPDGSTPDPLDIARMAANLFSAGQETTVRLLATALQRIADYPDLQDLLRERKELIPQFIEETVRFEGPIKGEFRLAAKSTTLGGVDIKAGTAIMIVNGAANRDGREFPHPGEFRMDRDNGRRHLGFGHGIHTCPGAPLARAEVRITLERLLERTTAIRVSEEVHGPVGARRYDYMPTYMFRGITQLALEFDVRSDA